MSTLLMLVLLQTKKPGKAGTKSVTKEAKKGAARGSKGKGTRKPKNKPNKTRAKKNSNNSKAKEDSKEKGNKPNDPCKLVTSMSIIFSCPLSHGHVDVGPVWTLLYPLFPGVLIGQSVFLYSQQ